MVLAPTRPGVIYQGVGVSRSLVQRAARQAQKEFCQVFYIAMGPLAELETQLIIVQNLKFIEKFDN